MSLLVYVDVCFHVRSDIDRAALRTQEINRLLSSCEQLIMIVNRRVCTYERLRWLCFGLWCHRCVKDRLITDGKCRNVAAIAFSVD